MEGEERAATQDHTARVAFLPQPQGVSWPGYRQKTLWDKNSSARSQPTLCERRLTSGSRKKDVSFSTRSSINST